MTAVERLADFAVSAPVDCEPLVASLPIAFLVAAILHANNVRDIDMDVLNHKLTLANLFGRRAANLEMVLLYACAYAATVIAIGVGALPWLENVTPGVPSDRSACWLATDATSMRVKKQRRVRRVPEVLRLNRMRIAPQAGLRLHRCAFGGGVRLAVGWALLILILLVVPRHSGLHLVEASILTIR